MDNRRVVEQRPGHNSYNCWDLLARHKKNNYHALVPVAV